jgi:hypothetical protein
MKDGPWTSGPRELLEHAKDHLAKKTDVDNRFAMISVDNAVELMLKTYLHLPKSVTGLGLTRKEIAEYTATFHSALNAMRRLVPELVSAVPLGEIEWFHRIRNRLYHEGIAITVERDQVVRYLKHAESVMRRLFHEGRGDTSPRNAQYQAFFEELRTALLASDPHFTRAKAPAQSWWDLGIGRTGFSLTPNFTKDAEFRVEIYVDTGEKERNDAAFDQLLSDRVQVERRLGNQLVWDALPERRACRIYLAVDGTIDDDERLDELVEWATPTLVKFRDVFRPLIKNLDLEV